MAIVGYAGFGNFGDDMILAGIERLLEPTRMRVTTLFGGPQLGTIAAFPDARRRCPWRLLPMPRALLDLRGSDLLVVGGGGLLNDYWPLLIPRYLAWIIAARLVGTRVIWIGIGVGPIRRRFWRWMARRGARLSDLVLVRDEGSATLLGAMPGRVEVIPDPVLFLPPPTLARAMPTFGLIVRAPVHARDADIAPLIELLAAFAVAARASGLRPSLLTMAPAEDRDFASRVADRLALDGERPAIHALGPSAELAWRQLGELQAAVSVRLHGVLLAAIAGVPCVPIAYDEKVAAAARRLGLGDVVVDARSAAPGDPVRCLEIVQQPARVLLVADRVSALRDLVDEVREMLP